MRREHQVEDVGRTHSGWKLRAESRLQTEHDGHSIPLLQTTTLKRRENKRECPAAEAGWGGGGWGEGGVRDTGIIGGGEWALVEGWVNDHCMSEMQTQKVISL